MRFLKSGETLAAALAVGSLLSASACAASQTSDAAAPAQAGSFHSIMAEKLPGLFGPHLAAADQPVSGGAAGPAAGSFQAVMAVKQPGLYGPHLAAADTAQTEVAASTCRPGSFAAVMSAKLPPNARPGNADIYKDCH
jgi:hypothetical protein